MGQQLTALQQTIQALAEACAHEAPKNVLGNPAHAKVPSGNAKAPDKVVVSESSLVFDLNSVLGTSDAHGTSLRIWLSSTPGTYQDVASTWLAGVGDPDNVYGTGKNQATTGFLGQPTPSTTAANYSVDKLLGHGAVWDDSTTPPGSELPPRIEVDGIGGFLENVVIAKLNSLIDQYNQLLDDYNHSRLPSTATSVAKLPV